MTIAIIKVTIVNDPFTGQPESRSAEFVINSGGGPWYHYSRGGLPLVGNVQSMLEVEEAQLYAEASASASNLATDTEIAWADSRAWFVSNPNAVSAIFGGTVTQLDTNITNLINALFPTASAANKTSMRYALMAGVLACRCYANQQGLV